MKKEKNDCFIKKKLKIFSQKFPTPEGPETSKRRTGIQNRSNPAPARRKQWKNSGYRNVTTAFTSKFRLSGYRRISAKTHERNRPNDLLINVTHTPSIRYLDRTGRQYYYTAAVSIMTESNFSTSFHSEYSFQAHSRTHPWSFRSSELCPEVDRPSVCANLYRASCGL